MYSANERVILALDVSSKQEALKVVKGLLPELRFVKVGMELFFSVGPDLIHHLKDLGLKIFIDLKVHDIPNTAYNAVRSLNGLGCDIINVHCAGGLTMMKRAREAISEDTKLIGVTQLTSTDQSMLNTELGIAGSVTDSVLNLARLAKEAGLHGVVCSPQEVELLKAELGKEFLAVTPGVRPLGEDTQDQKRVMTPKKAIQAGSDYLVIGRPILKSDNPLRAFRDIVAQIQEVDSGE
ncbi:MAG: orotidine-5'-phosphate decarboxylase [Firmicutes bacterium]|nr:orotidine-5'-phosphate decarboxylase [Bacillota bacterium]